MPIIAARVMVTTSPTLLVNPLNGSVTGPITALIKNTGPATIFIGGDAVTASTGFEVPSGATVDIELISGDLLYGITASGTQEIQTIKLMS